MSAEWFSIQGYDLLSPAGSLAAARFDDSQVIINILINILSSVTLTLDTTQISFLQLYGAVSSIVLLFRLGNTPARGLHRALLNFRTRFGSVLGCFINNDSHRC
jgi:hypothetical protein